MSNLVVRSDACGRVWIEDAEHGRFPPCGFYLSLPQHKKKRDVKATLEIARKMAAVDVLAAALEASTKALIADRDCLYDSVTTPKGEYLDESDREVVAEFDELITANRAAIAKASG